MATSFLGRKGRASEPGQWTPCECCARRSGRAAKWAYLPRLASERDKEIPGSGQTERAAASDFYVWITFFCLIFGDTILSTSAICFVSVSVCFCRQVIFVVILCYLWTYRVSRVLAIPVLLHGYHAILYGGTYPITCR